MVIGRGDIGSVLKEVDRDGIVFFASGVSNSKCTDPMEFHRERCLLMKQDRTKHLVYFSSLSIYYSDSAYSYHKRWMEQYIKKEWFNYTIVRLGNIDFGRNPHTLLNYFKNKIAKKEPFEVFEVYRHIVSLEEFLYWMRLIKVGVSTEMNVSGRFVWVPDLVRELMEQAESR